MESNKTRASQRRISIKGSLRYQVILTVLFLSVSSFALIDPFLYRRFIDKGILSHDYHVIVSTLSVYVAYKIISFVVSIGIEYYQIWFSTHTFRLLNDSVFTQLLSVRENYITGMSDSEIQTLINNDTNRVLNICTDFYPSVISNALLSVISLYILARLSIVSCIFTIATTVIVLVLNHYFYKCNLRLSISIRNAWNNKMGWLIQSYKNISFIKINLLTSFFRKRYDSYVHEANKLSIKSSMLGAYQTNSSQLIFGLLELILLYYLGVRVVQQTLTLGNMIAIVAITPRFYSPLIKALTTYSRIATADSNIEKLASFLSLPTENNSMGVVVPLLSAIEVKSLSFRFDGEKRILYRKLTILFKENHIYLITGANGIGKSTIIRIITGCLQNDADCVFVNNCNEIKQLDLVSYRSYMHYAPQTPYLIKGSVAENIRLANMGNDVILEMIMNIDSVKVQLSLMGGLSRLVDSDTQLSGGEKQFVSLLQMIYHAKTWVFLDEPFSAMDENMRAVSCRLITEYKKLMNATIIIISHVIPDIDIDKVINIQ